MKIQLALTVATMSSSLTSLVGFSFLCPAGWHYSWTSRNNQARQRICTQHTLNKKQVKKTLLLNNCEEILLLCLLSNQCRSIIINLSIMFCKDVRRTLDKLSIITQNGQKTFLDEWNGVAPSVFMNNVSELSLAKTSSLLSKTRVNWSRKFNTSKPSAIFLDLYEDLFLYEEIIAMVWVKMSRIDTENDKNPRISVFQNFLRIFRQIFNRRRGLESFKGSLREYWLFNSLFRRIYCIFRNQNASNWHRKSPKTQNFLFLKILCIFC